jgi:hypothetical protein
MGAAGVIRILDRLHPDLGCLQILSNDANLVDSETPIHGFWVL